MSTKIDSEPEDLTFAAVAAGIRNGTREAVKEATLRNTGPQPIIINKASGIAWKIGGPIIGAMALAMSAFIWGAVRDQIKDNLTAGAAKVEVVKQIDDDNKAAHKAIQADLDRLKVEQDKTNRSLDRIERKLRTK